MLGWLKRNPSKNHAGRCDDMGSGQIKLQRVVKTYENPAGTFTALNGVDLHVNAGEFVSIIGKSGSGKSTLINMITGIDRPTAGQVLVGNTPVHTLTEEQIARWRGCAMGVVFQFFQLLPTLTAIENILLPMDYSRRFSPAERPGRAMALLERMGLADHAHNLPSTLSGGQQQSIAIARALANGPPVLAADEPTGNLDSKTAESVFRLFEDLADQGTTILMVTHDQELARRAQRTVTIADGEIVDERLNARR
jgi:ABC-type lipoprotein export system ATPase subunit